MTLAQLNELAPADAAYMLLQCCGSQEWASRMTSQRPFQTVEDLLDAADRHWLGLSEVDWLEAFAAHPRIGERSISIWSQREQAGALSAEDATKRDLAIGNVDYEKLFGFIFIVFASDKTADQMLALLRERLGNDRDTEIRNAVAEQMKITRLRLARLMDVDKDSGT